MKASAIKYDNGGGEITFGSGTSAYEICQLLAQIGIRDADEYYEKYVLHNKNLLRLEYVDKQSFSLDAKLFFLTIWGVIKKIFKLLK